MKVEICLCIEMYNDQIRTSDLNSSFFQKLIMIRMYTFAVLAKGTNFTVITQFFLESIYNTGQKGFVEDVSFIIFHYFLQEIVLLDNENSRTKVPHIFMDSQTDYHLAPPTTEYLNADVNLLFYNDPKLYTCEILTASEWYADEYNRNRFGHEYKHWFEDAAKHRFDNIFDKLEESNEVSNIIHHTNQ